MLSGIIMASGLSKRMGQNKLLMPYKNIPIFQHTLNAIYNSKIEHFVVVTCYSEIIDFCKKNQIEYVYNPNFEEGQSASIRLGVSSCPKQNSYMFFVADQPLLSKNIIDKLIDSYNMDKQKIYIPKKENTTGNPKIFPNKLREKLLRLAGDVRGGWIIKNHPELVEYVKVEDDFSFFDIDTMSDYKKLR